MGRPSIDPELMIRMLIVGYVFAIRSERLICREVQVNLAYRWFCKLGIEDAIPDHSAFSRARNERFREGDVFRRVFERVVEACISVGLVGGEGFAVDASLIAADANKQRSIAGQDWRRDRDPRRSSRAVKEYLATLDDTAWGAASDVVPKFVSPSDPAAQWTGAHKGPAFFAYSDNYLIDVKFGFSFGTWLLNAAPRMHRNKLATALANKLARIAWSILRNEKTCECGRCAPKGSIVRSASIRCEAHPLSALRLPSRCGSCCPLRCHGTPPREFRDKFSDAIAWEPVRK
jgi:transposase